MEPGISYHAGPWICSSGPSWPLKYLDTLRLLVVLGGVGAGWMLSIVLAVEGVIHYWNLMRMFYPKIQWKARRHKEFWSIRLNVEFSRAQSCWGENIIILRNKTKPTMPRLRLKSEPAASKMVHVSQIQWEIRSLPWILINWSSSR